MESLLDASTECRNVLRDLLEGEEKRQREAPEQKMTPPGDFAEDLTKQSAKLRRRLADLASTVEDESLLERILTVHDELGDVSTRLEKFYKYGSTPSIDVRASEGEGLSQGGADVTSASGVPSALHLSTPDQAEMNSGLSSPAFSIADSDESDSDDGKTKKRSSAKPGTFAAGKGKAVAIGDEDEPTSGFLGDMLGGLRINTAELEVGADREEPDEQGTLPPRSPTENKAKGQLSEEGELFRKAKLLLQEEEEDEDAEQNANNNGSAELGNDARDDLETAANTERNAVSASTTAEHAEANAAIAEGGASALTSVHDSDVSGEQLRKDLLKVEVPPKSHSPSSSSPASASAATTPPAS